MAKIAFIQEFWNELPGVMALSAVLRAEGHAVDVFIGGDEVVSEAAAFSPDVFAFSCTTGWHRRAAALALKCREAAPRALIVAGGPHPTFYPEFILTGAFDAICRGEGEGAMLDIAAATDSKDLENIPNLIVAHKNDVVENQPRPIIPEMDVLPQPDYRLYFGKYKFLRDNPSKMFLTGRGCPYSCSFCFNKSMSELYAPAGCPPRSFSPARAVEMIVSVQKDFGLRFVRFDDDVFILDKKWLAEFLGLYKDRIALPFSCLVRANLVTDEISRMLAGAGCAIANFGVESGDDDLRNEVLNKRISEEQIVNAARMLKKNGIKTGTFNMMNLPGETLDAAWKTVDLNIKIKTDYPWCSLVQPYPGTRLEKISREKGLLPDDFSADDIPVSYFKNSPIGNPDKRMLERLQKLFYAAVKLPSLRPLWRVMLKSAPDSVIDFIFKATYALRYSKVYSVPLKRVFEIGRMNRTQY